MKWLFQDPYLACGQSRPEASQSDRGFLFLHLVTSLSPGSASKKSISDKVLALFSEGMDWSAVWISLFIYCVGFFLSLSLCFFFLTFVCISAHRRGSWSVERPVGMMTSETQRGWVGEEVSHQEHCRCWRWSFVVSVTRPWGVFFSEGEKIGFRDKRSGSHSGICYFLRMWLLIFLFALLATPRGVRDLSCLAKDQTHAPCIGSLES